jgi:hypothetical protein
MYAVVFDRDSGKRRTWFSQRPTDQPVVRATLADWHFRTFAPSHLGTFALWHFRTSAPSHLGTFALWHLRTLALSHFGNSAPSHFRTLAGHHLFWPDLCRLLPSQGTACTGFRANRLLHPPHAGTPAGFPPGALRRRARLDARWGAHCQVLRASAIRTSVRLVIRGALPWDW